MAGFGVADLLARQILVQTCRQQVQVTALRLLQQRADRVRFSGFEAIDIQRRQRKVVVAGNLTQRLDHIVEVVARGHFVRQHAVILRAGVLYVGNRHQANVETLRGLIQFAIDRLFLRFDV